MALLLKSIWLNVLRGGPISAATIMSRSYTSTLSQVTRRKGPDMLMTNLKSAPTVSEVLAAVQTHLPAMNHKHMMQALRCLFDLQKANKFEKDPDLIIKNPAFSVFCQNFKKHARALEVGEAVEAIKVLSYLRVPFDSLITQTMLQLVRHDINLINTRQIMFLDFILHRYGGKNHLVDALKLALPLAFQIKLPLELDNQDLPLLRDMLSYCGQHDLPDRCVNNIITGLLLHDQTIDAQNAKYIIWSLCQINCTEELFPTRVQLLHICFDILTQRLDQLSYDDVLRTSAKLKRRIQEKHPEFYHEQFLDAAANYVVQNKLDFEKGLLVARVLSRIAHTNIGLVEYLCRVAAADPSTLSAAPTNLLFSFINCLSNNNYKPVSETWREIKTQISSNPVLDGKNTALPWTKLCLEMASLHIYEDKILSRVFSKQFLDEYLSREDNILDHLQLLTLHEAVNSFHSKEYSLPDEILEQAKNKYPVHTVSGQLVESFARALGSQECVAKDVVLPNGFVADIVICLKGGCPIKLSSPEKPQKLSLEEMNLPKDGVVVCVMGFNQGCFSMNSNRLRGTFRLILDLLEHQGFVAVALNTGEWGAAPSHERAPYLMREVEYKCREVGIKLKAH